MDHCEIHVNGVKEREQRLRRLQIELGRARLVLRPWELLQQPVNIIPARPPDPDPSLADTRSDLDHDPDLCLDLHNDLDHDPEFGPGLEMYTADSAELGDAVSQSPNPSEEFSSSSQLSPHRQHYPIAPSPTYFNDHGFDVSTDDVAGCPDDTEVHSVFANPVTLISRGALSPQGLCVGPLSPSPPQLSPICEESISLASVSEDGDLGWKDSGYGVTSYDALSCLTSPSSVTSPGSEESGVAWKDVSEGLTERAGFAVSTDSAVGSSSDSLLQDSPHSVVCPHSLWEGQHVTQSDPVCGAPDADSTVRSGNSGNEAQSDRNSGNEAQSDGNSGNEAQSDGNSGNGAQSDGNSGNEAQSDGNSGNEALPDGNSGNEAQSDGNSGNEALPDAHLSLKRKYHFSGADCSGSHTEDKVERRMKVSLLTPTRNTVDLDNGTPPESPTSHDTPHSTTKEAMGDFTTNRMLSEDYTITEEISPTLRTFSWAEDGEQRESTDCEMTMENRSESRGSETCDHVLEQSCKQSESSDDCRQTPSPTECDTKTLCASELNSALTTPRLTSSQLPCNNNASVSDWDRSVITSDHGDRPDGQCTGVLLSRDSDSGSESTPCTYAGQDAGDSHHSEPCGLEASASPERTVSHRNIAMDEDELVAHHGKRFSVTDGESAMCVRVDREITFPHPVDPSHNTVSKQPQHSSHMSQVSDIQSREETDAMVSASKTNVIECSKTHSRSNDRSITARSSCSQDLSEGEGNGDLKAEELASCSPAVTDVISDFPKGPVESCEEGKASSQSDMSAASQSVGRSPSRSGFDEGSNQPQLSDDTGTTQPTHIGVLGQHPEHTGTLIQQEDAQTVQGKVSTIVSPARGSSKGENSRTQTVSDTGQDAAHSDLVDYLLYDDRDLTSSALFSTSSFDTETESQPDDTYENSFTESKYGPSVAGQRSSDLHITQSDQCQSADVSVQLDFQDKESTVHRATQRIQGEVKHCERSKDERPADCAGGLQLCQGEVPVSDTGPSSSRCLSAAHPAHSSQTGPMSQEEQFEQSAEDNLCDMGVLGPESQPPNSADSSLPDTGPPLSLQSTPLVSSPTGPPLFLQSTPLVSFPTGSESQLSPQSCPTDRAVREGEGGSLCDVAAVQRHNQHHGTGPQSCPTDSAVREGEGGSLCDVTAVQRHDQHHGTGTQGMTRADQDSHVTRADQESHVTRADQESHMTRVTPDRTVSPKPQPLTPLHSDVSTDRSVTKPVPASDSTSIVECVPHSDVSNDRSVNRPIPASESISIIECVPHSDVNIDHSVTKPNAASDSISIVESVSHRIQTWNNKASIAEQSRPAKFDSVSKPRDHGDEREDRAVSTERPAEVNVTCSSSENDSTATGAGTRDSNCPGEAVSGTEHSVFQHVPGLRPTVTVDDDNGDDNDNDDDGDDDKVNCSRNTTNSTTSSVVAFTTITNLTTSSTTTTSAPLHSSVMNSSSPDKTVSTHQIISTSPSKSPISTKKVLPTSRSRQGQTNNISHLLSKWQAMETASSPPRTPATPVRSPPRQGPVSRFQSSKRLLSKSTPNLDDVGSLYTLTSADRAAEASKSEEQLDVEAEGVAQTLLSRDTMPVIYGSTGDLPAPGRRTFRGTVDLLSSGPPRSEHLTRTSPTWPEAEDGKPDTQKVAASSSMDDCYKMSSLNDLNIVLITSDNQPSESSHSSHTTRRETPWPVSAPAGGSVQDVDRTGGSIQGVDRPGERVSGLPSVLSLISKFSQPDSGHTRRPTPTQSTLASSKRRWTSTPRLQASVSPRSLSSSPLSSSQTSLSGKKPNHPVTSFPSSPEVCSTARHGRVSSHRPPEVTYKSCTSVCLCPTGAMSSSSPPPPLSASPSVSVSALSTPLSTAPLPHTSPSTLTKPKHVGLSVALLRLSRGQSAQRVAPRHEEELKQDGRTVHKTREEKSFNRPRTRPADRAPASLEFKMKTIALKARSDGRPPMAPGFINYGMENGTVAKTQPQAKTQTKTIQLSVKTQAEPSPQPQVQMQQRQQQSVNIQQQTPQQRQQQSINIQQQTPQQRQQQSINIQQQMPQQRAQPGATYQQMPQQRAQPGATYQQMPQKPGTTYQQMPQQPAASYQQMPQQPTQAVTTYQQTPQKPGTTYQQMPQQRAQPGASYQQTPQKPGATYQQMPQQRAQPGASYQQMPQQPGASYQQMPQQPGASYQQMPQQPGASYQQMGQQRAQQIPIRQEPAQQRAQPAQMTSATAAVSYQPAPTDYGAQPWEDEPEEGVYENEPQRRADVIRESDRKDVSAELPSSGMARQVRDRFLTGQLENRSTIVKRELTPPTAVEGGVYESEPQVNPNVVHYGEETRGEILPEQGMARNMAARFKHMEKHGPSAFPEVYGRGEYVTEPRGYVEKYEPQVQAGVFENQPIERSDVVKGDHLPQDVVPERGTARSMATLFKQMSVEREPGAPRGKREITPDHTSRGEYVTEPRAFVEQYEGLPESGVFESQPEWRDDVTKADEWVPDLMPERGAARSMASHFKEMGKAKQYVSPSRFKEFTPPREDGTTGKSYGVYENQPQVYANVVHYAAQQEDTLPQRGMARTMVTTFRQMGSGSNTPKDPRYKKEFTPPRDGGGVYENEPTEFIPDYNRAAESGILENQPHVRTDVTREDEMPRFEVELPERGLTRNMVTTWRQKESGSLSMTPTGSGKPKEFTPPREEPRVTMQRVPRTPKTPLTGMSDGSVHPFDLPEQYQPQAEATVFESEPERRDDVVREDDTDWMEGMPRGETTKKMLAKFRHIQQQAGSASSSAWPPAQSRTLPMAEDDRNSRETSPEKVGRSKSMRVAVQLEKCGACQKTVYAMEKIEIEKHAYHKSCFRCSHCHCILTPKTFAINKNVMFCTNHYKQLFATKGNYDEGFGHDQHKNRWKSDSNTTTEDELSSTDASQQ